MLTHHHKKISDLFSKTIMQHANKNPSILAALKSVLKPKEDNRKSYFRYSIDGVNYIVDESDTVKMAEAKKQFQDALLAGRRVG